MRRAPAPLLALLGVTVVEALVWVFLLPALQGPDEIGHFAYTQTVVERQSIPWKPAGGYVLYGDKPYSSEAFTLDVAGGFSGLAGNLSARPLWTDEDERIWSVADSNLPPDARSNGGFTSTFRNPPAYYLLGAVPYAAASGGSIVDRLYVMRLMNVALLAAAVLFAWLFAGQLFGRRRWLQFAAVAPVALQPQLLNLTATFNPDVLLVAEYAAVLWLSMLTLRRGPELRLVLATLGACALAALTHYRGIPLFAPGILAIVIAFARRRPPSRQVVRGAVVGAALVSLAVIMFVASMGDGRPREFVSYVWQFYLPRLPFMDPQIGLPDYDFREVWIDRFFGTFSHLEVTLPHGVTQALFWASLAGLVALAVVLVAERRRVAARAAEIGVLLMAAVALLVVLHIGAYRGMIHEPSDPVFTGRYLLPLLPLAGAAVAVVASRMPRRAGPLLAALVIAGAVVLQLLGAGLMLERFYG